MPEHLPQPGHGHPLIIRHRTDAERTARTDLARTVCTSSSHPAELTAPGQHPPAFSDRLRPECPNVARTTTAHLPPPA
jgi:hypothetical protein